MKLKKMDNDFEIFNNNVRWTLPLYSPLLKYGLRNNCDNKINFYNYKNTSFHSSPVLRPIHYYNCIQHHKQSPKTLTTRHNGVLGWHIIKILEVCVYNKTKKFHHDTCTGVSNWWNSSEDLSHLQTIACTCWTALQILLLKKKE